MATYLITLWLAALLVTFWLDDPALIDSLERVAERPDRAHSRKSGRQAN